MYLTGQGFGSDVVFALYLVSSLAAAGFYVGAGKLTDRFDVGLLQVVGLLTRGLALPMVALIGAALAASTIGLLVTGLIFIVIGVAWAVIAVSAATLVSRLAPEAVRGEALGLYTAISALAGGFGAIIGGWLAGIGYLIAFGVAGGLVLIAALGVSIARRIGERTR